MYTYHALIGDALSAHMIHINLSTIFYTQVEHSPTVAIDVLFEKLHFFFFFFISLCACQWVRVFFCVDVDYCIVSVLLTRR